MSKKRNIEVQYAWWKCALLQFWIPVATVTLSGCSHEVVSNAAKPPDATTQPQKQEQQSQEKLPAQNTAGDIETKALAAQVLSPDQFEGHTQMSYIAAKQAPALMQKLFCYCGCDHVHDHLSLLDCFKDDHSAECEYCRGEAVMAFKMNNKGASLCEIQKAVDLNWGPHYLWYEQPSETMKNYWKTRLWAPGNAPTADEKHIEGKPKYDPFTETLDKFDKKAHSSSGNCCGGNKEAKAARTTKQ